ncbi:hypothetical protein ACK8P5_11280 [Paenibacillus sp. EC2-1]|uniref:hypothetical protein n=1 Tax=Paenibacillus sp. EC2-1 TaxID=3388665 RepID=UPI003BEECDEA
MIEWSVAIALFMGASWFSFQMQSEIDAGLEAANKMAQEQNSAITTFEMSGSVMKDTFTYQGSEVLFMLRQVEKGEYEMSVDDVVFSSGINPEISDISVIDVDATYEARYTYTTDGRIVRIQQFKVR